MTDILKLPLWLIALGTGSAVMGITLITPALPVIAQTLQVSPEKVQLLLTAYLAMLASGQLVYGPLSDVFGRRIFFRLGALFIALSGAIAFFISDIYILVACRALQGLGAAACISMGRTMLSDHFSKKEAAKAMASVQTIQAIVPMLALTTGGAIVFYSGWEGVMGLITAAGILLAIGSFTHLPETHHARKEKLQSDIVLASYRAVLSNGIFWNFMMISAMQIGGFFTLNAFIPYAFAEIGTSPLMFGLWFALTPIGYILGNLFNRLYMVERGIERAALFGCALSLTSVIGFIIVQIVALESQIALAIPCFIFGFANGLTVANATIGGIGAAQGNAGTASGLIGAMTMLIGASGGAIVIAFGADTNSLIGMVCLLIMVLTSFSSAVMVRMKSAPAP